MQAGFGLLFDGSHQLAREAVEASGDKNELAEPQQGTAEGFTAGQAHGVRLFFEFKAVHGMNAEAAAFPYDFFSRLTFGYRGHHLDGQIIGAHAKGKTGVRGHAAAADDAAIFAHRIPAFPVFHGRENPPDHR